MSIWLSEKFDWLTACGRVLGAPLEVGASLCLAQGGYLSGSFARAVALCALGEMGKFHYYDGSSLMTWENLIPIYTGNEQVFISKHAGDVDFFFPSEEVGDRAVEVMKQRMEIHGHGTPWFRTSSAGYATEFFLTRGILFQLITKNCGEAQDVADSFDIANAKVYLTRGEIHFTSEWLQLERVRELGISRVDKPNLVWRGYKWFNRGHYERFSEGSDSKYIDAVMMETQRLAQIATEESKTSDDWAERLQSSRFSEIRVDDGNGTQPVWELITNKKIRLPASLLKASYLFDGYKNLHIIQRVREELNK